MGQHEFTISQEGVLLQYHGGEPSVTIPEGITGIGVRAFAFCKQLQRVSVPEGVTEISPEAFYCCVNLLSVTLPQSLKTIGERAFFGCQRLTDLKIPENVTELGIAVFRECRALPEITLPAGVTVIPTGAFSFCTNLKTVTLKGPVTEISDDAFLFCERLKQLPFPPAAPIRLGARVFSGCSRLVDASGMLILQNRLLVHHTREKEPTVVIPDHVTFIERNALNDALCLHLQMPHPCPHWEVIGAFSLNSFAQSLMKRSGSSIDFRNSHGRIIARVVIATEGELSTNANQAVLSIRQQDGHFDFEAYDAHFDALQLPLNKIRVALTRLEFPFELTVERRQHFLEYLKSQPMTVGKHLIDEERADLISLLGREQVFPLSVIPKLVDYSTEKGDFSITAALLACRNPLFVQTSGTKATAKPKKEWRKPKAGSRLISRYLGNDTDVSFPRNVEGVRINGIADATGKTPDNYRHITSVTLPEGYTTIGCRAFSGCENLETVHFPSTLEEIGGGAFSGCRNLKELVLSDQYFYPGDGMFAGSRIQRLVLLPGIYEVLPGMFQDCEIETMVICGDFYCSNPLFGEAPLPRQIFCSSEIAFPELERIEIHPLTAFDESEIRDVTAKALIAEEKRRHYV